MGLDNCRMLMLTILRIKLSIKLAYPTFFMRLADTGVVKKIFALMTRRGDAKTNSREDPKVQKRNGKMILC